MAPEDYLNVFLIGLAILIGAIMLNASANYLGITTWHAFIDKINSKGLQEAVKGAGAASILFMTVIYPFLLGLVAFLAHKWLIK